jgi:hypothetical protein
MPSWEKHNAVKPLIFYALHGLRLTWKYWSKNGWSATKARIRYVLRPPENLREALRLIADGDRSKVFSYYYETNIWGSAESRSGGGSTLESTKLIRHHLPIIFNKFGIRHVLDAPCGDFYWMKLVLYSSDVTYVGCDIVSQLVVKLQRDYADSSRRFVVADITREALPTGCDIMICRDCLPHLSFEDIYLVLKNFVESGATYLLTTTFKNTGRNYNIDTGHFRPLDLTSEPFSLPKNVLYEFEDFADPHPPHYMALWSRDQVLASLESIRSSLASV